MQKKDIYKLISKKLTSEISEKEELELKRELEMDIETEENFKAIKEYWDNFFPKDKTHSIIERTEKKLEFTYRPSAGTSFSSFLKIAAAVIFVLSFAFSSYHIIKPKEKIVLNEYSCAAGEIKEITLSDGTKIWLNSKSFLIASEPFVGNNREVKLFGEAYFEVAHNEEQPFIVKTPQLSTEVLGTHFNVIAYPTDEVHEISLHEGKVQLQAENRKNAKVILTPGQRAYFRTSTGRIDVLKTDLGQPAKWRDGILRFYDENLFTISKKLERKFHTKIFITDSTVGNLKFSAEFDVESLETILALLNKAHNFRYSKTENGIVIQSKTK